MRPQEAPKCESCERKGEWRDYETDEGETPGVVEIIWVEGERVESLTSRLRRRRSSLDISVLLHALRDAPVSLNCRCRRLERRSVGQGSKGSVDFVRKCQRRHCCLRRPRGRMSGAFPRMNAFCPGKDVLDIVLDDYLRVR